MQQKQSAGDAGGGGLRGAIGAWAGGGLGRGVL